MVNDDAVAAVRTITTSYFPFMELPAELRNRIYSYALEEDEPIKICNHHRRPVREGY